MTLDTTILLTALVCAGCTGGATKVIGSHHESSLDAGAGGSDATSGSSNGTDDSVAAGGSSTSTSDSTTTTAGNVTPAADCDAVGQVPDSLGVADFYGKYVDASGIPVLGSDAAPDSAVAAACRVVDIMLQKRTDVRAEMIANGASVAVIGSEEQLKDCPELAGLSSDWDNTRGIGASVMQPLTVGCEENLLCYDNDVHRGELILAHSFAHAMRSLGIKPLEPDFDTRLEAAYENALFEGKWLGAFASDSFPQYWAEGVQSWLNSNLSPPNIYHNEINTREELADYDPALYAIISEYLAAVDGVVPCL